MEISMSHTQAAEKAGLESLLIEQLEWRYATKKFDPSRQIPTATWETLEKALSLAPTSYGLQPYRVLNVVDPEVRKKLRLAGYNQPQITEASRLMVFAARTTVTADDIDAFVARIAERRELS